jgi:hypothetical protein
MYSTNVTICTEKIPITTATKSKELDFIATTMGIDNKDSLTEMDANPINPALKREGLRVIGIVFPKRAKLVILNRVPSKRPLAKAFS